MTRSAVWPCVACLFVGLVGGGLLMKYTMDARSRASHTASKGTPPSQMGPGTPGETGPIPADTRAASQPGGGAVNPPAHPATGPDADGQGPVEVHPDKRRVHTVREEPLPPEEETDLIRRLEADPMDKSVNPLRLGGTNNPLVPHLLMKAMDTYAKGAPSDLFLVRTIDALDAIYERTHQADLGEYIRRRYPELNEIAKRWVLTGYPFAEELVPILRDSLTDPSDPYLHYLAASRIQDEPSIWGQLQPDVCLRADVEEDKTARWELQRLKELMLGHR